EYGEAAEAGRGTAKSPEFANPPSLPCFRVACQNSLDSLAELGRIPALYASIQIFSSRVKDQDHDASRVFVIEQAPRANGPPIFQHQGRLPFGSSAGICGPGPDPLRSISTDRGQALCQPPGRVR